jgi:hypothetical protein
MKLHKLILFAVAMVAMSFNDFSTGLTDAERKYASKLLEDTRENLLKKVKGLTQEQLNFKPDASSWSVAECVEHTAVTESKLFAMAQKALEQPADPSKRSEVKMTDENIVKMITDRSTKFKTQEAFLPTGKFGNFDAALGEFITKRGNNIKYINATADDLRNHYNDFPFGKVDAYQIILFMAGHTQRHTAQIEEIMENRGFPKNGR